MSVLLWYLVRKFVEVTSRRPVHDFDALVGQVGTARTAVHDDGSVYVNGELWSARSQLEIPSGSHVKVVGRDGFVLVVEKA
jgi:membrane-bound serine protease (ClpP class)